MNKLIALLLLPLLGSCNYLVDRGLDAIDPYRLAVGVGTVGGVRAETLGLVETGIYFGLKPNAMSIGMRYGRPYYANLKDGRIVGDQSEVLVNTSIIDMDLAAGSYGVGTRSIALLPAIFSWVDSSPENYEWLVPKEGDDYEDYHWLWSSYALENVRYSQIHAFDIEFDVAILAYLDTGFSPGEVVDFFLGILTIDIAADDDRL